MPGEEHLTSLHRSLQIIYAAVAEQVFNQCSVSNETKDGKIWHDSKEYAITFDYEFIEDFQDTKRDFRSRYSWKSLC